MKTGNKNPIKIQLAALQAKYALLDLPQAGYEVSRSRDTFDHSGIVAGRGEDGYIYIIHNHIDTGVSLVKLHEFSKEGRIYFTDNPQDDQAAVLCRALQIIGKKYHAIEFNGLHFSAYCRLGRDKAPGTTGFFSALFAGWTTARK